MRSKVYNPAQTYNPAPRTLNTADNTAWTRFQRNLSHLKADVLTLQSIRSGNQHWSSTSLLNCPDKYFQSQNIQTDFSFTASEKNERPKFLQLYVKHTTQRGSSVDASLYFTPTGENQSFLKQVNDMFGDLDTDSSSELKPMIDLATEACSSCLRERDNVHVVRMSSHTPKRVCLNSAATNFVQINSCSKSLRGDKDFKLELEHTTIKSNNKDILAEQVKAIDQKGCKVEFVITPTHVASNAHTHIQIPLRTEGRLVAHSNNMTTDISEHNAESLLSFAALRSLKKAAMSSTQNSPIISHYNTLKSQINDKDTAIKTVYKSGTLMVLAAHTNRNKTIPTCLIASSLNSNGTQMFQIEHVQPQPTLEAKLQAKPNVYEDLTTPAASNCSNFHSNFSSDFNSNCVVTEFSALDTEVKNSSQICEEAESTVSEILRGRSRSSRSDAIASVAAKFVSRRGL